MNTLVVRCGRLSDHTITIEHMFDNASRLPVPATPLSGNIMTR